MGTHVIEVLPKGSKMDRFGSEYGKFFGKPVSSYMDRALPYRKNNNECKLDYESTYQDSNKSETNNYHLYQIVSENGLPSHSTAFWKWESSGSSVSVLDWG